MTDKEKKQIENAPEKEKVEISKKKIVETPKEEKTEIKKEILKESKKETTKKPKVKEKSKIKKTEAVVNAKSLPISTKYAKEICRYIKNKTIEEAIKDLEDAHNKIKAIPMRGEYGHKKGKRIAGGKYPKKATEQFIMLLKSLSANSSINGLNEPIIIQEAIANIAQRQMAKFGRWQRKRTHVKLIAKEKNKIKKHLKKEDKK